MFRRSSLPVRKRLTQRRKPFQQMAVRSAQVWSRGLLHRISTKLAKSSSFMYVGRDGGVISVLEVAMGPEFAGGSLAPAPGVQPVQGSMGMIAPNLRVTFDGVEYTGVEILGAASPNGPIVCCGTPINMDDMEVVGTAIQHNPDGDATVQVYRPKVDWTTDVYTFHPSQTLSKVEGTPPEDETDTTPATWTRWTAE